MSAVVVKKPADVQWWAERKVRCAVCGVIHAFDAEHGPTMVGIGAAASPDGGEQYLTRWYGIQCLQCGAVLRLGEFVESVMRYFAASAPAPETKES